jgi:hypothetical protein
MTGAIAHVGPNLPQDLLRATGRHSGPLEFDPERPTPAAERWMESKFAPWARAILEGWAAGEYDGLGQVIFSRADDSAQRLYYYLCELQRRGLVDGPEALIVDIAKVPRGSSVGRTADSLRRMADRLGVDDAGLAGAIEACNAERTRPAQPPGPGPRCLLAGTGRTGGCHVELELRPAGRAGAVVRAAGPSGGALWLWCRGARRAWAARVGRDGRQRAGDGLRSAQRDAGLQLRRRVGRATLRRHGLARLRVQRCRRRGVARQPGRQPAQRHPLPVGQDAAR